MSVSKRLLFDKNPADDPVRGRMGAQRGEYLAQFTFRIPTRRKNPISGRRWDSLWPLSLSKAEAELGIDAVRVNDGIMVRTATDKEALLARAQEIYTVLSDRSNPARFRGGSK